MTTRLPSMAHCTSDDVCASQVCAFNGAPEGGRCAPLQPTQAPCQYDKDCPVSQFCWLPNVMALFPQQSYSKICADWNNPLR